jgi:hypothetical protein
MSDQPKPISPWRGWNKTAYGIQTKGRPCTWSWWTDAEHFYQLAKVRASEMQQTADRLDLLGGTDTKGLR